MGQGLYEVLQEIQTADAVIKKICIKDPKKARGINQDIFTLNPDDIIQDPEINLVVELIDDAESAYDFVKRSMLAGKSVVSGNKMMIANHLPEMVELQERTGAALLYDASACGIIPVIRNL